MTKDDGGPAFPVAEDHRTADAAPWTAGMSLRDWFAGKALANPTLCHGNCLIEDLNRWFGPRRNNITRAEIVSRQAYDYADAMLAARGQS